MIDIFNSYEQRLQFTHEVEIDNKISFLDVLLIRNKLKLLDRFLNWQAKHPCSQKIVMVYNLVDKAINLCYEKFHDEIYKK